MGKAMEQSHSWSEDNHQLSHHSDAAEEVVASGDRVSPSGAVTRRRRRRHQRRRGARLLGLCAEEECFDAARQPRAADSCASAPVDPGERSRRMLSAQPMKPEQARLIQGHRVTKRRSHEDRVSVMGVVTRAYQDAVSLLHGNREASIRVRQQVGPALEMERVRHAAISCERLGEW